MFEITIYGEKSATQQSIKLLLEKEISKADLEVSLREVVEGSEVDALKMGDLIAVKVDQKYLRLSELEGISEFVGRCMRELLQLVENPDLLRIIVPTDFSQTSEHALRFAVELAKNIDAMVKLVHVYFPVNSSVDGIVYVDAKAEDEVRKRLRAMRIKMEKKLLEYHAIKPYIEDLFIIGHASKEIEKLIEQDQGDVIVMGTVGEGDTFKRLLGSVSVAVATHARCPVFVIPPDVPYHDFEHILYSSEDPALDRDLISAVKLLSGEEDCSIDVVHLYEEANDYAKRDVEVLYEDEDQHIKEVLLFKQDLLESLHDYAAEEQINLIVMERKKRSFWQRIFHHSATRMMTIRTRWPLLILHEDDVEKLKVRFKTKVSTR